MAYVVEDAAILSRELDGAPSRVEDRAGVDEHRHAEQQVRERVVEQAARDELERNDHRGARDEKDVRRARAGAPG